MEVFLFRGLLPHAAGEEHSDAFARIDEENRLEKLEQRRKKRSKWWFDHKARIERLKKG